MGNRISKVYTRTGDDGTTGLADGSRQPKDTPLITAMGEVDELNSVLGVLRAESLPDFIDTEMQCIQNNLFALGGELAMPEYRVINNGYITSLENQIDEHNRRLKPLKEFILPGGNRSAALCHLARAVCRRAERSLVACGRDVEIRSEIIGYVNRLSDYLFVAARILADDAEMDEVFWEQDLP